MDDETYQKLIKLGSRYPDLRPHIRPILDRADQRPKPTESGGQEPEVEAQGVTEPEQEVGAQAPETRFERLMENSKTKRTLHQEGDQ